MISQLPIHIGIMKYLSLWQQNTLIFLIYLILYNFYIIFTSLKNIKNLNYK